MELIKYGGLLKFRMLHLYNICWKNKEIPNAWRRAKVTLIFIKGDKTSCNNYRSISLLDSSYKIYARILNDRLKTISESVLSDEQTGFRKGRSPTDGIFIIKQIIEKYREFNRETH